MYSKVENPSGNPLESSPAYTVWNRGKKSIALDLKEPEARSAVLKLTQDADVFLESFRPGVADRWGLGYPSVKVLNPTSFIAPSPLLVPAALGRSGTDMRA
jgi:formyl-CoA transferase/CoA:oxalate CoA-transferase